VSGRSEEYMDRRNAPLIQVLMDALQREYEKIECARAEIVNLKQELQELTDLGVELPAD
jgi:hypothetical protein